MKKSTQKTGYSLVEVLVSISVLLIALVGPMTIAAQGIKSSAFSLEQNAAFFLAQEGVEALFSIKTDAGLDSIELGDPDTSWDWVGAVLNAGPCSSNAITAAGDTCNFGADFRDGTEPTLTSGDCDDATDCQLYIDETAPTRAVYIHDSDSNNNAASPYTRVVTVEIVSSYAVKVTSTVEWTSQVFGGATQTVELVSYMFDTI